MEPESSRGIGENVLRSILFRRPRPIQLLRRRSTRPQARANSSSKHSMRPNRRHQLRQAPMHPLHVQPSTRGLRHPSHARPMLDRHPQTRQRPPKNRLPRVRPRPRRRTLLLRNLPPHARQLQRQVREEPRDERPIHSLNTIAYVLDLSLLGIIHRPDTLFLTAIRGERYGGRG